MVKKTSGGGNNHWVINTTIIIISIIASIAVLYIGTIKYIYNCFELFGNIELIWVQLGLLDHLEYNETLLFIQRSTEIMN